MTTIIPIVVIGLFAGGWFVYMTFFHKKMNAKYSAVSGEVQKKFEDEKDAIIGGYLTDREKYGILSEAVGPDEKILGIASYVEPKTVGKSLTEGLKTSVTRVRKVNMDLFFMAVTDKNLHCIESNGENTVDHTVFALENIEDPKYTKASSLNVKNAVTGVSGDLNTFSFTYKGEKYSFNMYKMMAGYAMFTVSKDSMSGEFQRYFPGQGYAKLNLKDPEFLMENTVNMYIYDQFKKTLQDKLGVTVP